MAQLNFNAAEVAPDAGYGDPLPDGWYNVMADDSEVKPASNNASTGNAFLAMRFVVLDGDFKGRKLFTRFNIRNSNPVAQEIAYKQLSAVAHAVGVLMVQDSTQLHNIPLKVRVKVVTGQLKDKTNPAAGTYDPSNDVIAYKNINEVVQQPVAVAPVQHAPAAPAGFPAPAAFAGFAPAAPAAPAFQAPAAPAAPNPAQWAAPAQQQAPQFATAQQAPAQQFAPPGFAPQQAPAQAPAFQGYQAPEQQFAQQTTAPQFAPQQQFTPPAQQAAPAQFAPPSFSPPVQQAAPAEQPVQQFAAPAQQQFQAPQVATQAEAAKAPEAAHPAQQVAPPWARPAA